MDPNQPEINPKEFELDLVIRPGERKQVTFNANVDAPQVSILPPSPDSLPPPQPPRWFINLKSRLGNIRLSLAGWLVRLNAVPVFRFVSRTFFHARGAFALALAIYLLTRLIALPDFPIYFFCDEAATTNLAADLLQNGLRDKSGAFLPPFFENDRKFSLGASVYLQALPTLIFGKSVWVARGTAALATGLCAVWLALILKDIFKNRTWWSAPLLLAVVPGWFLLSRTAFECSLMVTGYTGFLYYYLRYRQDRPVMLYPALALGALAFYAYVPGQMVIVITGIMLLIYDLGYHWKQRKIVIFGAVLIVALALPFIRFLLEHPGEYINQGAIVDSALFRADQSADKLGQYLTNYFSGLNPLYLFFPTGLDIPYYTMKGYGNLSAGLLVFVLLGLALAGRAFRQPANRVVVIALLAAPSGAALASIHITRMLSIVVPVVLLAALGISACLRWLERRLSGRCWSVGLFLVLSIASFGLLGDALTNGPTWFQDYGVDGMQYGASQVYSAAMAYHQQFPNTPLRISPTWAFRADEIRSFFLPPDSPILSGTPDSALQRLEPPVDQTAYLLTQADYRRVLDSQKFQNVRIVKTLPYPNGQDGFYIIRLAYREDIQEVFAQEVAERRALVEELLILDNEKLVSHHSKLDGGPLVRIFDGDLATLIQTREVNPLVIELDFQSERRITGVSLLVGAEPVQLTVSLWNARGDLVGVESQSFEVTRTFKTVELDLSGAPSASRLRLELLDVLAGEQSIVHLWEANLRQVLP